VLVVGADVLVDQQLSFTEVPQHFIVGLFSRELKLFNIELGHVGYHHLTHRLVCLIFFSQFFNLILLGLCLPDHDGTLFQILFQIQYIPPQLLLILRLHMLGHFRLCFALKQQLLLELTQFALSLAIVISLLPLQHTVVEVDELFEVEAGNVALLD